MANTVCFSTEGQSCPMLADITPISSSPCCYSFSALMSNEKAMEQLVSIFPLADFTSPGTFLNTYCSVGDNISKTACQSFCQAWTAANEQNPWGPYQPRWCDSLMQKYCAKSKKNDKYKLLCSCINSTSADPWCTDTSQTCATNGYKTVEQQLGNAAGCAGVNCQTILQCIDSGECTFDDNTIISACGTSPTPGPSISTPWIIAIVILVAVIIFLLLGKPLVTASP